VHQERIIRTHQITTRVVGQLIVLQTLCANRRGGGSFILMEAGTGEHSNSYIYLNKCICHFIVHRVNANHTNLDYSCALILLHMIRAYHCLIQIDHNWLKKQSGWCEPPHGIAFSRIQKICNQSKIWSTNAQLASYLQCAIENQHSHAFDQLYLLS
jgi:hypothetical protein